jgi:hypothetical protein
MLAMTRLGKPDTGNPSVRFDEGSEPGRELTTSVGLISTPGSGLLYTAGFPPVPYSGTYRGLAGWWVMTSGGTRPYQP